MIKMLGKKKKNKEVEELSQGQGTDPAQSERDADFSALDREGAGLACEQPEQGAAEVGEPDPEIVKLREELAQTRKEVAEINDKYLRALAECENYKKRALKERSDLLKYQGESIFFDLLDVLDNLELALTHAGADPAALKDGVDLIYRKFVAMLGKWDVRGDSALGRVFDPTRHNAISRVAVDDAAPGTVINELKKTYMYKDKLLRPADVVVAVAKPLSMEEDGIS